MAGRDNYASNYSRHKYAIWRSPTKAGRYLTHRLPPPVSPLNSAYQKYNKNTFENSWNHLQQINNNLILNNIILSLPPEPIILNTPVKRDKPAILIRKSTGFRRDTPQQLSHISPGNTYLRFIIAILRHNFAVWFNHGYRHAVNAIRSGISFLPYCDALYAIFSGPPAPCASVFQECITRRNVGWAEYGTLPEY